MIYKIKQTNHIVQFENHDYFILFFTSFNISYETLYVNISRIKNFKTTLYIFMKKQQGFEPAVSIYHLCILQYQINHNQEFHKED